MKHWRFALDWMFLFMLVVSIIMFCVNVFIPLDIGMVHAIEYVDFFVLGGYYFFFLHGLKIAEKKFTYVQEHWIMVALLVIPFVPLARLFPVQQMFKIGTNTLWHALDSVGML